MLSGEKVLLAVVAVHEYKDKLFKLNLDGRNHDDHHKWCQS